MFTRLFRRTLSTTFTKTMTPLTTVTPPPPPQLRKPTSPLIVITGPTGTGKSNLAVHLAASLSPNPGAEIINADAMQLYTGLPIITNKISEAEQGGVRHHLLGTIGLEQETWTVGRFVGECERVIGEVRKKGKVPIVVGGTGYYVHGLVLGGAVLGEGDGMQREQQEEDGGGGEARTTDEWLMLDRSTEEIYEKLREVDPVMARRWHPSDRRKIQRSLEIYLKTGKKASEVYAEQKKNRAGSIGESEDAEDETTSSGHGRLRHDSLIFWLDAEDAALKDRLNKRVDSMVQNGLVEEAKGMATFEQETKRKNMPLDKSKGIWVSIGYKELEPWLEHVDGQSETAKSALVLQQSCIEAVKASTRRYAKRQNRYIRIRLAQALAGANASDRLFLVDCTDLEQWQHTVVEPARNIVNTFLDGGELPRPANLSELARKTFEGKSDVGEVPSDRVARKCESCDKILMSEKEWAHHIQSRSHKKILEGIRKRSLYGDRWQGSSKVEDLRGSQGRVQASTSDLT